MRHLQHKLSIARGEKPADLPFKNARFVNVLGDGNVAAHLIGCDLAATFTTLSFMSRSMNSGVEAGRLGIENLRRRARGYLGVR